MIHEKGRLFDSRPTAPAIAVAGLLSLLATPRPLHAEGERPLSLSDALSLALRKNHEIALERESVRAADALQAGALGAYDLSFHLDARYRDHTDPVNSLLSGAPAGADAPFVTSLQSSASLTQLFATGGTLSATGSISRDKTDNSFALLAPSYTTSVGIEVRQPLLRDLKIDPARRGIRIAAINRDLSAASLRRTLAETAAAVERTYWSLVAARRDVVVRRSSVALADEQRSDTSARIDAEVERRKGELYAAEEAARRAEHQLKTLIAEREDEALWSETVIPSDSPETAILPVDVRALVQNALEKRPELASASISVEREGIEIEAARDRLLPRLDVVGAYVRRGLAGDRNPNALSFTGGPVVVPESLDGGLGRSLGTVGENRFPDASIGLALSLPIGNRAARGDLVAAEAGRSRAAIALVRARQAVAVEVRNAALAVETAAQRIGAARAGREAAETQLRAERERFAVGLSTNFFVLTRQNDLVQAQVTENAALSDYRRARAELSRAAGTLLDELRISVAVPRAPEHENPERLAPAAGGDPQ